MVANPSLMREMTRNADRALGQLDAMPGGGLKTMENHHFNGQINELNGHGFQKINSYLFIYQRVYES